MCTRSPMTLSAMSARSSGFSWRLLVSCCSSPARTWPICSWCVPKGASRNWRCEPALGASRGRITRALLAESVVLALAAGVVGVVLAWASIGLLRTMAPAELPRVNEIGIDLTVLAFTLAVSVLSGTVFGLFAVLRFGRPTFAALKEGGRSTGDAPARHRTRNALVVGQIALALTLLIVSGLLVRTFVALRKVDPGFTRPEEIQTFVIAIPPGLISDDRLAARTFENVAERLSHVPGVTSVGLSSSITMDGESNGNSIEVESVPIPERSSLRRFKSFAPGYFETMGIRLVAGRSVTWSEIHERRLVIVISEPLAREIWGDPMKALGKRIRVCCGWDKTWREIVGVTGAERDDGLARPPTAIVYWPMLNERYRWRTMAYAVRSSRVGKEGFLGRVGASRLGGEPESAACWRADGRRDPGTLDGADIICSGDAGYCCECVAPNWRGRDLRSDRLRRRAAHSGDRYSNGARSTDRGCAEGVSASWTLADRHRDPDRRRCGHGRHPDHVYVPVRCRTDGSRDIRRCVSHVGCCSTDRNVSSSASRNPRRSASGAPSGIDSRPAMRVSFHL